MTIRALKAAAKRPWIRRTLTLLFLTLVAILLHKQSAGVDWPKVRLAIRAYQFATLANAAALAGLSYLIYSTFDLLGRRYVGFQMSTAVVMRVAFISYAFNQSLGSLIGGVAFRFRLYSRLGLNGLQISKVILVSVFTNWLGYSVLVGGLFLSSSLSVPNGWNIGRAVLQVVGALLLVTASGYLVLCALYANKTLKFRKQTVCVPGLELALAQLLLSVIQWPTAAAILFVLLNGSIEFTTILGALLLSSIATVLTHIPAGIGVLEAIFVGIIGRRVPIDQLLAAILVFRVVYYLVPLFVATLAYLATETLSRRVSVDHVSAPRTRNRAPTQ